MHGKKLLSSKEGVKEMNSWDPEELNPTIISKRLRGKPNYLRIFLTLIVIALIVGGLSYVWLKDPQQAGFCMAAQPVDIICGSGIGITEISTEGKSLRVGILDEQSSEQFVPGDETETHLESLIKEENQNANSGKHFTIIQATTLSLWGEIKLSQFVGMEELRGAYLAQHEYNQTHQIKMRLVIANLGAKNAPEIARSIAQRIHLYIKKNPQENILGVAGLPFSAIAIPVAKELSDVAIMGSSPSADELTGVPNFHRVAAPNKQQTKHLIEFIHELSPSKVLIAYSEDPYSKNLGEGIETSLQQDSIQIEKQAYVGENLNPVVDKIKSFHPNLLFFAGFPNELSKLKATLIGLDIPSPTILGAQALYEVGGYDQGDYAGFFFSTSTFPDEQDENYKKYKTLYRSTFDPENKHPGDYGSGRSTPHSALAYDAIKALGLAYDASGTTNGIHSTLDNIQFKGATGYISFNGSDPVEKPVIIACVDKNGFTHAIEKDFPNGNIENREPIGVCTV